LRELLLRGEITNFTKGIYRSEKARISHLNAVKYEAEFYDFLISKIPEVRVHEHKIIRPGNVCCDFFIYSKDYTSKLGTALDLFYAQDLLSLGAVINIKLKRYSNLPYKIIFILIGNKQISQAELTLLLLSKKISLPKHIDVFIESEFKNKMKTLLSL
jgi:hypothetical protein